jgi:hypothetical protein
VWVEEVDKGGEIFAMWKKMGRYMMVSVLESSTRDGVKGGGVGDLQRDAPEEREPSVDTVIRIQ